MNKMKLTCLLLLLSVTVASGRCLHADEFFAKTDSASRLRGGTVYQFVGFPRGSGFRFIIHAHGPEALSLLHSLEDAATSASDQAVSSQDVSDTNQELVVGQDVQMMNAFSQRDSADRQDLEVEGAGEDNAVGSTQDFDSWIVEEQANQAIRSAKTTLAVLYPFLFSHDLSSHMDRLVEARMRALSDLQDAFPPLQTEGEDGSAGGMSSNLLLGDSEPINFVGAGDEEPKAEEGIIIADSGIHNSVREAWEGVEDYAQSAWTSILKALNYAARWLTSSSSESILAVVVILLQAFLLISTFVMATIVICSRIYNQEEPAAMILSASHVPGVEAPLLSDRSDSEYSSDEEDGKPTAKYQPPKVDP